MLQCLICSKQCFNSDSTLVEAFQHLRFHYLICGRCFRRAASDYHTNTFGRVSSLGRIMYLIS